MIGPAGLGGFAVANGSVAAQALVGPVVASGVCLGAVLRSPVITDVPVTGTALVQLRLGAGGAAAVRALLQRRVVGRPGAIRRRVLLCRAVLRRTAMGGGRPGGDAGRARDTGRGGGPRPAAVLLVALDRALVALDGALAVAPGRALVALDRALAIANGALVAPDGALVLHGRAVVEAAVGRCAVAGSSTIGSAVVGSSTVGRALVGPELVGRAPMAGSACDRRGAVPVAGRGGIGVQAVRLGALLLEGAALLVDLLALRLGLAPATLGGELLLLGLLRLPLGLETGPVGLDLGLAGLQIALLDGLLLLSGLLADLRGAASILLLLSLLAALRGVRAHDDQDDDDDQDQQDDPDDHRGGQVGHGRLLTARLLHRWAEEHAPDGGPGTGRCPDSIRPSRIRRGFRPTDQGAVLRAGLSPGAP